MSGIVGSKLNIRGSGTVAKLGTDGQHLLSSGAGKSANYETVASATYDDDKIQSNIDLLEFKTAVNGSLAKYNLQDQIIDEYTDATGIDAGNSTNERLTAGVYDGAVVTTPSVTSDHDATGTDGDYTWYKWTATGAGSYETDTTQDHEWLIVAGGGGGGGKDHGSGGGAGGYRTGTTLSLTGGNEYTVTVGAGGNGTDTNSTPGDDGGDSIISGTGITTITSTGGGGGGAYSIGSDGGSGGGGGAHSAGTGQTWAAGSATAITQYTAAGETTTVQGYDGGDNANYADPSYPGAGGGGAGAVGQDAQSATVAGNGGAGVNNDIIETGTDVGYAGGGGGGIGAGGSAAGSATHGGGAGGNNNPGSAATANTGGGGGGGGGPTSTPGGNGGSGIVILRRLTNTAAVGDLTLQSTDTTAMAEPDYADMVMLMENSAGTATINTDIKGWISKDSGSTFTQGTLVDEGTWGTNKKLYAFHDLDISAQSGTSMCYKITTHNQSASKITKIHATSIGSKA